jgi:phage terminase large subunit-like protein
LERRYAGSELGRQELEGEMIDNPAGTLWQPAWIEEARVAAAPDLRRTVVGVDPPVTAGENADACGIIAGGIAGDGRAYVLADLTLQRAPPNACARAALEAYRRFAADRIVAEVNQGGDLVETVLRQIDETAPVTKVRATRGKWIRAEPIAALYAERRVSHVGRLGELEEQLLSFTGDGTVRGRSPDRLDALVWALTDLMTMPAATPRLRIL